MAGDFSRVGGALSSALNPIPKKILGAASGAVQMDTVAAETQMAALNTMSQDGGVEPLYQALETNDKIKNPMQMFDRWDEDVKLQLLCSEITRILESNWGSEIETPILGDSYLYVSKSRRIKSPLKKEAESVARLKSLRGERSNEILAQRNGFWDVWTATVNISPESCPSLALLLQAISSAASGSVMQLKARIAMPRPVDVMPGICPILRTPGHGSYPSGHSTIAHLEALVICALIEGAFHQNQNDWNIEDEGAAKWKGLMWRRASRIAKNREVAGVHFECDSVAGKKLAGIIFNKIRRAVVNNNSSYVNSVCERANAEVKGVRWK